MTIKQQKVYIKSENSDTASKTFGLIKPDDKKFVNFVSEKELFVFTKEQLNEYTANVIKYTFFYVKFKGKGKKVVDYDYNDDLIEEIIVDGKSIDILFEEVYQKLKV